MKYATLGKHVNLPARLQTSCQPGSVLLSYATWLLAQQSVICTPKGEMHLKGIVKPVKTYELQFSQVNEFTVAVTMLHHRATIASSGRFRVC